jgi:hypothetical protein
VSLTFNRNFVHSQNVALSHVLYEAALTKKAGPSGRPFNITDPGPGIVFQDLYDLATQLSVTPVRIAQIPPLPLLLVTYLIEAYVSVVARFPFLAKLGFKEPGYPLSFLQPTVIKGSVHILIDDSAIRRSAEDGGLGYKGACTTLEGMVCAIPAAFCPFCYFTLLSQEEEEELPLESFKNITK